MWPYASCLSEHRLTTNLQDAQVIVLIRIAYARKESCFAGRAERHVLPIGNFRALLSQFKQV